MSDQPPSDAPRSATRTQQLVARATRGDRAALEDLLVRYLPALQAFVRLRAGGALGQRESSADVVQSVCRELLENAGDYQDRGEAAFKNWLFTAAANKIVDRHRFHHRGKRDADREVGQAGGSASHADLLATYATLHSPSRELMAREQVEKIEKAFAQLSEQYREVIALSRIAGLTYAEIGAETGRSETAVRGLVVRGMARLSQLLMAEGL